MIAVPVPAYQQRWIDDDSRFSIMLKARQVGITWSTMLALVMDCMARPRQKWYYLTLNAERAKEAIEYAVIHCEASRAGARLEIVEEILDGVKAKLQAVTFPNGSRIIGLTSNPRTARGCSGSVVLDEFAHHQDAAKIWTALYPVVTRGYKVRVLSTPNGKQGKFYELWDSGKGWSRHRVDIHQAVADGMDVNIKELREGAGTEDDWQQEYCCEFLDEAKAWLPYSLIEAAQDPACSIELDSTQRPTGPLWLGVDVARKRDLSVLWLNEQRGEDHWTRAVVALEKAKFSAQRTAVDDMMRLGVRRCCIDANGIGAQLSEELVEAWGEALVEPVMMSGQTPALLAGKVKDLFERGRAHIPTDDAIRRDLHQVRKVFTDAGSVRFEAPRTRDGHADRFWALGLALQAAEQPVSADYEGLERGTWAELSGETDRGGPRSWFGY